MKEIDADLICNIFEELDDGKNKRSWIITQIGKRTGYSRPTIVKYLESAGLGLEMLRKRKKKHSWQVHHANIMKAYEALLKENGKIPSIQQVSDRVGLSWDTCDRHLSEYKLSDTKELYAPLYEAVMRKVAQQAIDGNTQSQKLFLEQFKNEKFEIGEITNENIAVFKMDGKTVQFGLSDE